MKTQKSLARVVAVFGIAVLILASPVRGQECPESIDSEAPGYWWGSVPNRIEVSGSYAYVVSDGHDGFENYSHLVVVDVSDSEGPRILGSRRSCCALFGFQVSEELVFELSAGEYRGQRSHLTIFELSALSDPAHTGYLSEIKWGLWEPGPEGEIAVVNDFVYLSGGGLWTIDVTDPSNPVEVGFLEAPWGDLPTVLAAEDTFVYVALREEGLRVIDVSDPAQPVEVGSWSATWSARDIDVSDGFVYVADGAGGLRIIDVTDPAAPTQIGVLETDYDASGVSIAGSHAIVLLESSGVAIVDVSNPTEPEAVGMIETESTPAAATLVGTTAYISEGESWWSDLYGRVQAEGKFRVMDLSVPEEPVQRSSFGYLSTATDIAVAHGVRYLTTGDNGLVALGFGSLDTPGFAFGVTLLGDLALVADGHKGLRIVNVADPTNMAEIGFIDTPGGARRVAVGGDRAYVADGDGGVRIIDISAPESPVEIAAVETTEPALDVVAWGDTIYVVSGFDVKVIDVSIPTAPVDISTGTIRGLALAVADDLLYVGSGGSFSIWNVRDPSNPDLLVEEFIGPAATDIKLSGQYAYIAIRDRMAESRGGVRILDILNPYHPVTVGTWERDFPGGGEQIWAVEESDGRIYLAAGKWGVEILDARCLTTYWVGIVAHNDGAADSRWRSDVIIRHDAEHDVGVEFILHTQHGEITAEGSIGPRSQGVFEDVVGLLDYEGKGALEIRAGVPIDIVSRIYSETDSASYGSYSPGYRSSDSLKHTEVVWFDGLRQLQGVYRSNINVTNTGTEPGHVHVTLYRSDGIILAEYDFYVDPGMVAQDLQPFKNRAGRPDVDWGFAKVLVESGQMLVSATVIDSRTNHPMMVPMTKGGLW